MKVVLIRPPIVIPRRNQTAILSPPIGIAYVAGMLRHGGHEVVCIDGLGADLDGRHPLGNDNDIWGLSLDDLVSRIPADAGMIGVSAGFSFEWPMCRELIARIRQRFPDRFLFAGGEHMTALPEALLDSALDAAVLGEGEETALALADALDRGHVDLATVDGIAFVRDGAVVQSKRRARIRALDDIPWPAWDLLPIEAYLDREVGFGVSRGRSMPVLASRGCPYQCTFCSNPNMWTTRWTARDPDILLDELAHYQQRYGATNFDFYDLTAIVKRAWILDFCAKIKQRGMTFTWQLPSGTRSEAIDAEVATALYQAGCRNLSYSPESGSPDILTSIKKKIGLDSVIDSIASSVRSGLNVKTNIMFGFPGETEVHIRESYRFIARMALAGAHDLSIWAFSPYPGSELFNQLRASRGMVLDDAYFDSLRSYADASRTVSYSEHIGNDRLRVLRTRGVALFYLVSWFRRPWRPFRMVINILSGRQESRSEMALAAILQRVTRRLNPWQGKKVGSTR